jgi:hypothetical protein
LIDIIDIMIWFIESVLIYLKNLIMVNCRSNVAYDNAILLATIYNGKISNKNKAPPFSLSVLKWWKNTYTCIIIEKIEYALY